MRQAIGYRSSTHVCDDNKHRDPSQAGRDYHRCDDASQDFATIGSKEHAMAAIKARTLVGEATEINETAVERLREQLAGALLSDSDDAYDDARRVWNGNIDRRPALIARCTGTPDVQAAVRFAVEQNLRVAVRGGGHNAAGHATCDGGIVIDLTPMKGIRVDPTSRTAYVQAGATWGEL